MADKPGLWYRTARAAVRWIVFPLLGGVRYLDAGTEPPEGPLIIAPVHFSVLDPPLVSTVLKRPLTFMAKEELFQPFLFGPLIRSLGAFPIRRGAGDAEAIKIAIRLLEEGRCVLLFPEGTRGDGVHLGDMRNGVLLLAKRTGAAVLPIGIAGTHDVLPKGASRVKRHRMGVTVGTPLRYAHFAEGVSDKEARELFNQALAQSLQGECARLGLELKIGRENSLRSETPDPE